MVAKKESAKTRLEEPKVAKVKAVASRKTVSHRPPETEPVSVQPQTKVDVLDEKSRRTISNLTAYLSVGVLVNVFVLIVQFWATLKAQFVLSAVSFLYILIALVIIGTLVWCINLLKQKRIVALWAFVGFIALSFFYTVGFRWYGGKTLFMPMDLVAYVVQAVILFEIYRLKRNKILS